VQPARRLPWFLALILLPAVSPIRAGAQPPATQAAIFTTGNVSATVTVGAGYGGLSKGAQFTTSTVTPSCHNRSQFAIPAGGGPLIDSETNLHSDGMNVFFAKYSTPCFWLAFGAVFTRNSHGWRILFAVLPFMAAFFQFSLAVVRLHNGVLQYRRFAKCRAIPRREVVSCGLTWPPFIGYIRLSHFVAPWGRLYFVLDRNLESNPFRRADFALLRYIRGQPTPPKRLAQESGTAGDREALLKLVAAGAAGALVTLLQFAAADAGLGAIPGRSVLEKPWQTTTFPWSILERLHLLGSPLMAAALCVIFVALAVHRRRRPKAWLCAFVAGLALPGVFLHWPVG